MFILSEAFHLHWKHQDLTLPKRYLPALIPSTGSVCQNILYTHHIYCIHHNEISADFFTSVDCKWNNIQRYINWYPAARLVGQCTDSAADIRYKTTKQSLLTLHWWSNLHRRVTDETRTSTAFSLQQSQQTNIRLPFYVIIIIIFHRKKYKSGELKTKVRT